MSFDLGRRLLLSGTIQPGELRRAVHDAIARERPFPRALADASVTARELLERPLVEGGHPTLRAIAPDAELAALLPEGLAARILTVPLRRDVRTGTVDVAVVDPLDAHAQEEVAFHLGCAVRSIAVPLSEIERALALLPRRVPAPEQKITTAEYESASRRAPIEDVIPRSRPAITQRSIQPIETTAPTSEFSSVPSDRDEMALPLVRRARNSMGPPSSKTIPAPPPTEAIGPPPRSVADSVAPPPPSRRLGDDAPPARMSLAPPITLPFDPREQEKEAQPAQALQMVVDFSAAARQEQREGTPPPPSMSGVSRGVVSRRTADLESPEPRPVLEPKRPPFPSLTPVLESIDLAIDRDALVEALVAGLCTTARCAALFAPRRGRFVGIGAGGELDPVTFRNVSVPAGGAIADAITRGERIGSLDAVIDRDLAQALELHRMGATHVLLHASFVSSKPALILASYGFGDVLESSRRARVLSTSAAAALMRMLRGG